MNPLRLSLLREQVEGSKSAVARYWLTANRDQRSAICYIARLNPDSHAEQAITAMVKGDREAIRQAVIRLEWQSLFHGCMSHYEWHEGCVPAEQSRGKPKEITHQAERLERSKHLLNTLVNQHPPVNYGQKKTPITGAANT
ncbi:hypothetical protein GWQ31_00230 [Aeromonas sp. 2MA4]|uniref:hypothetical protein n=1 Tax=Aeromonas sp. 2MA4 TaxID=2699195 RepID=UPI0023DDA1CC|nr:hypothetical protein [Aeromonas sp. 2MA4]MDF2389795.1 hypothetical protein [Aeromonas sp. 2MA4]